MPERLPSARKIACIGLTVCLWTAIVCVTILQGQGFTVGEGVKLLMGALATALVWIVEHDPPNHGRPPSSAE